MKPLKHKIKVAALAGGMMMLLSPMYVQAAPVDKEEAEKVARNFWNKHLENGVQTVSERMEQIDVNFDGLYAFSPEGGIGFVLVSADDRALPIPAYSYTTPFDAEKNSNVRYMLGCYQEQIEWIRENVDEASEEVSESWKELRSTKQTPGLEPLTAVQPLLRTAWNQNPYYNDLCPYDSEQGVRTPVGCIVTAMAQVMRYWKHPIHGTGNHSYQHNKYGILGADFSATTYDYDNMPYSITAASSTEQRTAVATLMYHCGISVEMDYNYDASGAFMAGSGPCTQTALIDYFDYTNEIRAFYRNNRTDTEWDSLVRSNIDAGWPLPYSGYDNSGGHCWVCDGYDAQDRFHMNWGWGGVSDGYYLLSNLAPGSGGTGGNATYTFNLNQHILTNVHPNGITVAPDPDPEPVNDDCVILRFPYTMDFDQGGYDCITYNDVDGDGNHWGLTNGSGYLGSICAYIKYTSNHGNNDYINTPIVATPGRYTVSWKTRCGRTQYPESYEVYAGDSLIFADTVSSTTFEDYEADFEVAEGQSFRIRFRNISYDQYYHYVDNIVISQRAIPDGVEKAEQMATLKLWPNPATESVSLETPEGGLITLTDVNGKIVYSTQATIGRSKVNISALPTGMYFLSTTSEKGTAIGRMIKK